MKLMAKFDKVELRRIPRSENDKADNLAKLASAPISDLQFPVIVETLFEPTINTPEVEHMVVELGPSWMDPIVQYLKTGTLPNDRMEARCLNVDSLSRF